MHPYIGKTFRVTPTKYEPGKGMVDLEPVTGVCVAFEPDHGFGKYRLPDGSHIMAMVQNTVLLHADDGYPAGYADALDDVVDFMSDGSEDMGLKDVLDWCQRHAEMVRSATRGER